MATLKSKDNKEMILTHVIAVVMKELELRLIHHMEITAISLILVEIGIKNKVDY